MSPPDVLFLAVVVYGFAVFVTPQFDPDFWWTVAIGLQIIATHTVPQHLSFAFTAVNHPFISQEWGSELIDALIYRYLGMAAIIFWFAAVTWVGFFLGIKRILITNRSRWLVSTGAALVLVSGLQIWGPSPQMYSFALLGVLLVMLDSYRVRPNKRVLGYVVGLFALWGNLHGGFTIGLGVLAVVLAGEAITTWRKNGDYLMPFQLRNLALASSVAFLAPMFNPNGVGVYVYPWKLLTNHLAQASLNEWAPPDFHQVAMLPALVFLISTLVFARWAKATRLTDILLAGAGAVLMLYAVRDIPIFALLALPLWADGLEGFWTAMAGRRTRATVSPMWFVATVMVVIVIAGTIRIGQQLGSPDNQMQSSAYATQVGRVICQGPASRIFAPYGSSGWLIYRIDHLEPKGVGCSASSVFIFGEVVLMGRQVFADYLAIAAGGSDASTILRQYRVTLVWQAVGSPLAVQLQSNSAWTCVYAGAGNILYAPDSQAKNWHASRSQCPASAG